jgi:hypothetical protein
MAFLRGVCLVFFAHWLTLRGADPKGFCFRAFFDKDRLMESLILAQNERWRRGLGMQVERV